MPSFFGLLRARSSSTPVPFPRPIPTPSTPQPPETPAPHVTSPSPTHTPTPELLQRKIVPNINALLAEQDDEPERADKYEQRRDEARTEAGSSFGLSPSRPRAYSATNPASSSRVAPSTSGSKGKERAATASSSSSSINQELRSDDKDFIPDPESSTLPRVFSAPPGGWSTFGRRRAGTVTGSPTGETNRQWPDLGFLRGSPRVSRASSRRSKRTKRTKGSGASEGNISRSASIKGSVSHDAAGSKHTSSPTPTTPTEGSGSGGNAQGRSKTPSRQSSSAGGGRAGTATGARTGSRSRSSKQTSPHGTISSASVSYSSHAQIRTPHSHTHTHTSGPPPPPPSAYARLMSASARALAFGSSSGLGGGSREAGGSGSGANLSPRTFGWPTPVQASPPTVDRAAVEVQQLPALPLIGRGLGIGTPENGEGEDGAGERSESGIPFPTLPKPLPFTFGRSTRGGKGKGSSVKAKSFPLFGSPSPAIHGRTTRDGDTPSTTGNGKHGEGQGDDLRRRESAQWSAQAASEGVVAGDGSGGWPADVSREIVRLALGGMAGADAEVGERKRLEGIGRAQVPTIATATTHVEDPAGVQPRALHDAPSSEILLQGPARPRAGVLASSAFSFSSPFSSSPTGSTSSSPLPPTATQDRDDNIITGFTLLNTDGAKAEDNRGVVGEETQEGLDDTTTTTQPLRRGQSVGEDSMSISRDPLLLPAAPIASQSASASPASPHGQTPLKSRSQAPRTRRKSSGGARKARVAPVVFGDEGNEREMFPLPGARRRTASGRTLSGAKTPPPRAPATLAPAQTSGTASSSLQAPSLAVIAPTPQASPGRSTAGEGDDDGVGLHVPQRTTPPRSEKARGKRKADETEDGSPPGSKEKVAAAQKTTFAVEEGKRPSRISESSRAPSSFLSYSSRKRARIVSPLPSPSHSESPSSQKHVGSWSSRSSFRQKSTRAGSVSASSARRGRAAFSSHPKRSASAASSNRSGTRRSADHSVSMPLSAILSPRPPSVDRLSSFHMRDPRKPPRPREAGWGLRLGDRESPASPFHAWAFWVGFLFPPLWWFAAVWRIPRTRVVGGGDPEKEAVVVDDPQIERDARTWRTRCRVTSILFFFTYLPVIILLAIFVPGN